MQWRLHGWGAPGGAGVVDEHVDAAKLLDGAVYYSLHVAWLAEVAAQGQRPHTESASSSAT